MENYFLIAIGGTGMRCLESFLYLCTLGMFDGKEFNVLLLDTDINNGNFERVKTLIDNYNTIKGDDNPTPTYKTFFSAKIKKHVFTPNYDQRNRTFKHLTNLNNQDNQDIADLFFDTDSQAFNLEHGYRAQTQIGSYLMYHGILDSVRNVVNDRDNSGQDIVSFVNTIWQAGADARICILGSVFGGTGASSIPIIPRAIDDAIKLINGNGQLHPDTLFSCTLLTNYFTFNLANANQINADRVIADAGKFAINSQAALMFYEDDTTITNTYNSMYHIGWPKDPVDFDQNRPDGAEVITGGSDQKNPAHILELMSAAAAYDFFTKDRVELNNQGREIVCKTIEYDEKSENFIYPFIDFFPKNSDEFENKLACFYLLNFILRDNDWDLNHLLQVLHRNNNIHTFVNIEEDEINSLNNIIMQFGYSFTGSKEIKSGWLWQLKESTNRNTLFFNPKSFTNKQNEIKSFNYGKLLVKKKHHFTNFLFPNPYDQFRRKFPKNKPTKEQNVNNPIEQLLAQMYNTFTDLLGIL